MLEYTSSNITQLQNQYNMLVASLEYCSDKDKKDIYVELNKIEENILNATNEVYDEAYDKLFNTETFLLDDERKRLSEIINLIIKRKEYIKNRKDNHKNITNSIVSHPDIKGEEHLGEFERKLSIINKYVRNIGLREKLVKDIALLEEKEKVCLVRLRNNDKMNVELEDKMIDILNKTFNSMDLFSLLERTNEIELAFRELSFAKEKAKENVEIAVKSNDESTIVECNKMLESVTEEYNRYYEKKMLLELIKIYDNSVNEYEELLTKREKINDILKKLSDSEFYKAVSSEMEKQYNTIKIQEQDVKTYKSIRDELVEKKNIVSEIEEENESQEFKVILEELIKNEKARRERILQEQRRKEYEERQRKLIEETKKHEEIRKKQKLIEEARKKEIERRTKELLEAKTKTVIIPKEEIKVKDSKEKVEEIVPKSLPSNTIETKMKTVFVPKEEVFTNYEVMNSNEEIENIKEKEEIIVKKNTDETVNEEKDNRDSIFDSIFDEMKENLETENNKFKEKPIVNNDTKSDFSIPVIKNNNLVATKIKEEEVEEEDLSKFKEKGESKDDFEINDVIFPDMPL